ncbi:gamma-glutamylcyclotransferase [Desulfobacterota bacterium AH_259_B03_O07]|nr:gamma-glutamylcyclotransferase [Desulfobacterota bacterium AH_259_B03_O07]
MKDRIPSAVSKGIGTLRNHTLAFHKVSKKDGSGKCDIVASDADNVIGVLFRIDASEKPVLDRFEGLGSGYDEKEVEIITSDGRRLAAITYYATDTDSSLKPYTWYVRHIVEGAREAIARPLYSGIGER